jgi:membrane protease subunit HflK
VKSVLRWLARLAGMAALAGIAALCAVRIEVGERAIVLRLGRYDRTLDPGLNFRVPLLEQIEREPVKDRRIDFGLKLAPGSDTEAERRPADGPEPRMLTGDQNLVDLQFFTEYRVDDVRDYRLKVLDPELVIREVVRATMREVVGRSPVEEVIGAPRGSIPEEVRELASERLQAYQVGVALTQVGLQSVEPPEEVKPAFDDVTSAVQDRDRSLQDAERYRAELLQQAAGEAAEIGARAQAARDSAILAAQGEASRFLALLEKYRQAPEVMRARLYLQTLETILPRMEKVILEEGSGDHVLPYYLPLGRPPERPLAAPERPASEKSAAEGGKSAGGR